MFDGSFDIWHWVIVLVIVIAIFGTKKLRHAGGDLGAAVRNFKKAMKDGQHEAEQEQERKAADVAAGPSEPLDAPHVGTGSEAGPATATVMENAAHANGSAHDGKTK